MSSTAKHSTWDFLNHFNLQLTLSILVICISQVNYGFDNQGYGAIQSIDSFQRQFGEYDPKKKVYFLPSVWLSMFNSFGFIGLFVGVNIGSMVSKRFGRRWCMFSMSCFALVTATITITSTTASQIMVGRVLNCEWSPTRMASHHIFLDSAADKSSSCVHWHGIVRGPHLPVGDHAQSSSWVRCRHIPALSHGTYTVVQ